MIRLIAAELFKLRTTRLYLVLLAAAAGLVVVVTSVHFLLDGGGNLQIEGAASTVTTDADLRSVLDVSGVAALFTLVLGATAVAGEVRHGTIARTFLLTPARPRVLLAKTAAYVLAGMVFGLVVELVAGAVAVGWLTVQGAPIPIGPEVWAGLALVPLSTGLAAGFGVGVSAIVPNQLGAVLVAVGWVMVVEQLVGGLAPEFAQWLPFAGAGVAISGQHPELAPGAGIAIFLLYLSVVVSAGIVSVLKRDVA